MKSAVQMLVWLTAASAALHTNLQNPTGGREVLGEAVKAVLEASSLPQCSLIFLTDGTTSHHTLYKELGAVGGPWGLAVFQVPPDYLDSNSSSTKMHLTTIVSQARQLRQLAWCVTLVVVSDDPAFFSAFARSSDNTRLQVWATRLLAVTRLSTPAVRNLMDHYWTFSMMNTMFLTLSGNPGTVRCEVYSHLPYGPLGAQEVRVASWTQARGLVLNARYKLFPEKYNNFHGRPVNMTASILPPYWMDVEESGPNGTTVWGRTGRDYIILETIAAVLNLTVNVLPYGEWDEVMSRLETRVALMSPTKLAFMPHLLEIYDFTLFIEPATLGFSMAKPTLKPRWQSLYYPLRAEVWVSILALLLLVPIVLLLISYAGDSRNAERRLKVWKVVEVVFGMLLAQTSTHLPRSNSARVLIATWLVFAFITGTAYRGNLTAFLTIPKYPARPETLKQLIASGAPVTMPPDLVDFYNSFKKSDSIDFKTLAERTSFVPSFKVGMLESIENNKAYIYERMFMELMINEHFTEGDGSTRLYVARENIMPGYCGWPLARDAPFKVILDRYIMAFHGAGLIGKWTKDILKKARLDSLQRQRLKTEETPGVEERTGRETGGIMALTIVHMQGPLLLLLIGLLLSLATFSVEVLVVWCVKPKGGASVSLSQ